MTLRIFVGNLNKIFHQDCSFDILSRNHLTSFPPAGSLVFLLIGSVRTCDNFNRMEGVCERTCYMNFACIWRCRSLKILFDRNFMLWFFFCRKAGRSNIWRYIPVWWSLFISISIGQKILRKHIGVEKSSGSYTKHNFWI